MIDITLIDLTDEREPDYGPEDTMKAPQQSMSRERAPEGAYPIICTQIIDLGTRYNQTREKDVRDVRFMFLTPHKIKEGDYAGSPISLLVNFPYSMYLNSNLCKFIQQWRGKNFETQEEANAFDFSQCLKKPAYANVVHNGQYDNVGSIMPLPAGQSAPEIPADAVVGTFTVDDPDLEFLARLGKKTQEKINSSYEMQKRGSVVEAIDEPPVHTQIPADLDEPDFNDDIPF